MARGWRDEPVLLLGRDGALEPPAADVLAEEVPYGHVRGLRDEWIRAAPWAKGEQEVRDAHEADRRMFAGTPTRAFATFEQGRPLAYALLLDGGRDGMLEDVYTTPEARGRGLATAVIAAVLHAARAERHEIVFVPTDAVGGAGALYERLGFEPLTILHWLIKSHPPPRERGAGDRLAPRLPRRGRDRVEPWAHGTVVRADDVPSYYEYNLARVEGGDPGLDAEALAAAAEPALADLGHRRIEVEDTAAGARLAPGFAEIGWVVERLAFLHRELPAPPPGGTHGAELASRASRPRASCARPGRASRSGARRRASGARRSTSPRAAARAPSSAPTTATRPGFAAFSAHGDTAEIEPVFCLPERRNGGLGGALVARALQEAHAGGARHALIEADDDGDAKRLYERLGFRTVWVRHMFTRVP